MPPKSEEPPIDLEFEFWTELPTEMQLECVKRMDFKSRMQLRGASKQDKLLVESAPKYHFGRVVAELNVDFHPRVTCKNLPRLELNFEQEEGPVTTEFHEKAYQLVAQFLKFSKPETFDFVTKFTGDIDICEFLEEHSCFAPFRFKNLILNCDESEIVEFFVKNCNSQESICLTMSGYGWDQTKLNGMADFPSVINPKITQLLELHYSSLPYKIIRKWLEKDDLELGKALQIRNYEPYFMEFLGKRFKNRVISKTAETLRIRTNDTAKHILIRTVEDPEMTAVRPIYFSFLVIPAEQKESEYEKDDKWATVIYEKEEARKRAQRSAAEDFSREVNRIFRNLGVGHESSDYDEDDSDDYY